MLNIFFNYTILLNVDLKINIINIKMYKCEFCEKEIKTKSNFNLHQKTAIDLNN